MKKIIHIAFIFYIQVGIISAQNGSDCLQTPDTIDGQKVYLSVDQAPEYPEGYQAFIRILSRLIVIPKSQRRQVNQESRYLFTFVIDVNGSMRNFCVIRPTETSIKPIDLTEFEDWIPGQLNGNLVPVRLKIPMIICLN